MREANETALVEFTLPGEAVRLLRDGSPGDAVEREVRRAPARRAGRGHSYFFSVNRAVALEIAEYLDSVADVVDVMRAHEVEEGGRREGRVARAAAEKIRGRVDAAAFEEPAPKKGAEFLRDHVYRLAEQSGTKVVHRGRGIAYRSERLITVPEVRGPSSYLTALHELGHVLGTDPKHRLAQEVEAWRWALANSIIEPPPSGYRMIARCLRNYFRRAQRRAMILPDGYLGFWREMVEAAGDEWDDDDTVAAIWL